MKRIVLSVFFLLILTANAVAGLMDIFGEEPEGYSLTDMKYFNWVTLQIVENYVDQSRIVPYQMLKAALRGIEKAVPELVVKLDDETLTLSITMGDKEITKKLGERPSVIWGNTLIMKWVFGFVDRNIRDRRKLYEVEFSAINEMLSELDPHSNFLNASQCNELRISTAGKFGGLGIIIQSRNGYITVVSPIKGTPAYRAGIKSGDRIIRIDDESAINMTLDQAVNRLRGEPGTPVTIYVLREGWSEPKKMVIMREEIRTRSVDKLLLSGKDTNKKVAYLKINGFSDETYADVKKAFGEMKAEAGGQLHGLILDLRDNPGGLLDASVKISDLFLGKGIIVSTQAKDGEKVEEKRAEKDNNDIDLPLAVLINRGSASASEIVAGALKDNNRAIVIGQRSFGKGSVQILYDRRATKDEIEQHLKDYKINESLKDCLKLTIAEYMTPRGVSIQSIGITPDIYLVPQIVYKYAMNMYYFPRYSSEEKLERHLESSRPPEDKPFLILPYVYEKDEEEDEGDDRYNQDVKEDFEMRYAKELLLSVNSNNRMDLISSAKKSQEIWFNSESKKFAEILTRRGIDFRDGETTQLDLELITSYKRIIYKNSNKKDAAAKKEEKVIEKTIDLKEDTIQAGNDYFLSVSLKNRSDRPIYRLSGIIESHDPVINGRELFWGMIPPHGTKSYDVILKLSKSFPSVIIPYRVRFLINGKYQQVSFEKTLNVKELPMPRYVLSYQIFDRGERSNENGRVEKGETLQIKTVVKNMGKGEGINPRVAIQNQSGKAAFLKNGMCTFPSIKSGEEHECNLQVVVRDEPTNGLKFRLYVSDDLLYEDAIVTLNIPTNKSIKGISSGIVDLPIIDVVSAPLYTAEKRATVVFSVSNLRGKEDIYVRVNENKSFYIKNAENKNSLENIKADLALKEGFNNIYIFVRVNDEQYTYKRLVIATPKKYEQNDIIAGQ